MADGLHGRLRHPRTKLVALAVASCFAGAVHANPVGPTVMHGTASFNAVGNALNITNSPNAIINWQGFSIGASEIIRFIQNSAASSVLNRVTGTESSSILGQMLSNGRVLLINPNGVFIGGGAVVDVAGFTASSLKISDADFLAGKFKFTDQVGAARIVNQGIIRTPEGGQVYLIAPGVENSGVITSPSGQVILAAGKTVELVDMGSPYVRVEFTAPDNAAVSVGQVVADAGSVGIYGTTVKHSGVVRANSAQVGANGKIAFKATKDVTLDAGSRIEANGPSGGEITVQGESGTLLAQGVVEAKGEEQQGGQIQLFATQVGLIGSARVDASGQDGGGTVLIGGDRHGHNPDVQNAWRTYFGPNATVKADAIRNGDGGKVIVWSDDITRFYGNISARGGTGGGNGGFAEVSGKEYLIYRGTTDLSAQGGRFGTLLLDPRDITIQGSGSDNSELNANTPSGEPAGAIYFADPNGTTDFTLSASTVSASTADIVLQAQRDVNVDASVNITTAGVGFAAQAGRDININQSLTTNGGKIRLEADSPHQPGGADGIGQVNITAPVNSCGGAVPATCSGASITLIGGGNSSPNGGFALNANVNAGTGGISVALSTNSSALDFFIGAGGNTQLSSNDTGFLLTTGTLTLGRAISGGPDGTGTPITENVATGAITLTVNSLSQLNASPISLSSNSGTTFELVAGSGGITLDRPLTTFQTTVIDTTGPLTINSTLSTSNNNLIINAASVILGASGSISTGSGTFSCTGTGCGALTVSFWDGGALTPNWFDAANWSGDQIPDSTRDVTIGSGFGTIQINGAATAKSVSALSPVQIPSSDSLAVTNASQFSNSLILSGGSLTGSSFITIASAGTLSWSGGSIGGTGGTLFLDVGRSGALSNSLALNLPFQNDGTLTLSGATVSGTGSIANSGIITTAASTSNTIGVPLTNLAGLGTIQPLSSLALTSFPTNDGNISIGSGVTLSTGGASLANSATGIIQASGTLNLGAASFSNSGSATFDGSYSVPTTNVSGGTVTFNGTASTGTLNLSSGTVNGTGSFSVTTDFNKSGGSLGTTFTDLSITKSGPFTVDSFTATNSVSLTATGGALLDGNSTSVNVTAPTATLTAAGGINLDTGVSTLTTNNTVSGNTAIRNSGALVVSSMSNSGGGSILLTDTAGITLNGAVTASGGTGDAIVLAGTSFSAGGSAALNPGTGRFLVWSGTPSSDNRGSLTYGFKQYNATYGVTTPAQVSGNGFLYSVAPVIAPTLQGTVTKTYDGTTAAALASGNYATTGIGVIDGDTVVLSNPTTGTYAAKNVGSGILVTASSGSSLASATNGAATVYGYQMSGTPASGNIGVITTAGLTVTAQTDNRGYNGTTSSVVAPVVTGTLYDAVGTAATQSYDTKNVGTLKTLTASGLVVNDGNSGNNYAISYVPNATGVITTAGLTVTANNAAKTYGQTTSFAGTEFSTSGLQNGETIGTVTLISAGAVDTAIVGAYPIVPSAATGGTFNVGNYAITYNNGTLTVSPASLTVLTVTANNAAKTYGQTLTFTGSEFVASGLQNGETIGAVTLTSAAAVATAPVGPYAIVPSAATGGTFNVGNYAITYNNGTLTVSPAPLTVAANNQTKTYGNTFTFTGSEFTSTGLVNGDTIGSVSLASTGAPASAHVAGNPYPITASAAAGGTFAAGNYTITYNNGTLTVNPAVTNLSGSRTYDATTSFAAVTFGTINGVNGETLTLTGSGTVPSKNVFAGTQPLGMGTLTLGNGTGLASDYTLTGGTGTVTPATLTVSSFTAQNKVYDATTAATVSGNLGGAFSGDVVSLTSLAGSFANKNVGTGKTVTVSGGTLSGTDAGNYQLTSGSGSTAANITPATLTATGFTAQNKVYDATTAATVSGGTLGGAFSGDEVSLTGISGSFADKNVGTGKIVTVSGGTLTGTDAGNYQLASASGSTTANITSATLLITAATNTKTYDGDTSASATPAVSGLKGADTITGLTEAYSDFNVGTGKTLLVSGYTINDGTGGANYKVTLVNDTTGVITQATPTPITTSSSPVQLALNSTTNQINISVPNISLPLIAQAANTTPAAAYLLTTGGQIPLDPVATVQTSVFVNVNTGQETIISPLSVPMEGVYVSREDSTMILVVTFDELTGAMVILRGSISSGIEVGTKTQVSKNIAACS